MITTKQLKIARNGYILISVVFYITGILCLVLPDIMTRNAVLTGGAILIAYGIIKIIGYFSRDLYCLAFQYDFACGLFLIILGIFVLCINTRYGGNFLEGLGLLILLDSLLGIQTTMEARKFGLPSWPMILVVSLLSGASGMLLFLFQSKAAAGCALLAEGVMRQYIVQCTVKLIPCKKTTEEITYECNDNFKKTGN